MAHYSFRSNMNNDVVGHFFRFGIKWNIRSSAFAPGKNRTFIFLLLESFAFLKPAIIESRVTNVVPFLHSSGGLVSSISDGFDRDALFLSSSLSACANTGWGIAISLFFSCDTVLFSLRVAFHQCFLSKLIFRWDRNFRCFSELLFLWLLLVIINNRSKTDFCCSLLGVHFAVRGLDLRSNLSNWFIIVVPGALGCSFLGGSWAGLGEILRGILTSVTGPWNFWIYY